ncbi:MAG: dephospho-CoA kinase [Chthoniobacteraceae bacterium]|nr:dephospho-CoA kinase [Chthoniobacteraceae bacterium]
MSEEIRKDIEEIYGKRRVAAKAPALPSRTGDGSRPVREEDLTLPAREADGKGTGGGAEPAAEMRAVLPVEVFDADAVARELVEADRGVREAIVGKFGQAVLTPEGTIDRGWLRESVFGDTERRKALEAILHPPIRARWIARVEAARRTGAWLLLDIPLLYETGAESACDAVAVVACREETQRERIVSRRGLSREMAGKIIATQTSLASKAARADYVIWNDAPEARLEEQAELFAGYLTLWMNNLPH